MKSMMEIIVKHIVNFVRKKRVPAKKKSAGKRITIQIDPTVPVFQPVPEQQGGDLYPQMKHPCHGRVLVVPGTNMSGHGFQ